MCGKVGAATEQRAQCAGCMKTKRCVVKREVNGEIREYDNFFYSEKHRGWLCKQCWNKAYKEARRDARS